MANLSSATACDYAAVILCCALHLPLCGNVLDKYRVMGIQKMLLHCIFGECCIDEAAANAS